MRLVVFGLTVSSSWGNGHATLWRALAGGLARQGHRLAFFERDVPWYARTRDLLELRGGALHLYGRFEDVISEARRELASADAALVTSYCPDGPAASALLHAARVPLRVFYDMDTPVTLARTRAGEPVEYLPRDGLGGFDLVLSFTGGEALALLERVLGARRTAPLYGSVDPAVHRPTEGRPPFRADLSYLGTYAASRQAALTRLFLEPARRLPGRWFALGGAQYPPDFPWRENVLYVRHLPPEDHPAFYCSSPLTLNVTRAEMAALGWCPSGRLFEAAACGVAVVTDPWAGLEAFLEPGREILVARSADEAVAAVERSREELARIGRAARERCLAAHGADVRARELVALLEAAATPGAWRARAPAPPPPHGDAGATGRGRA
jgi:spore maturation protein CgeB